MTGYIMSEIEALHHFSNNKTLNVDLSADRQACLPARQGFGGANV